MHIAYKLETKSNEGRIVRVEDFTRFTVVTTFNKADVDLAHRICLDLTKALSKVGTICPTSK